MIRTAIVLFTENKYKGIYNKRTHHFENYKISKFKGFESGHKNIWKNFKKGVAK